MKKRLYIFLLLCSCILINGQKIHADSNMDGGGSGGGTQEGTNSNYYVSGDDGVRITIVDTSTKCRAAGTRTIDFYRLSKLGKNIVHFGKKCKIEYMGVGGYQSGQALQQSSDSYVYDSSHHMVALQKENIPTIVSSSSSSSNIEEIKAYFNNAEILEGIAAHAGISYANLISGNYKILIEPMIYLTFEGNYIALTAHEAAKLDISMGGSTTSGGALRAKFVSFTHKNLPLSIFLEKKDLGIKPWTGSKYARVENGSILSSLGVGILSFAAKGNDVDLDAGNYVYRPNTDVVTSVDVAVTDGNEDGATCDNPISVRFSGAYIGTTEVTGITIPQGGSRFVWIKWRTPNVTNKTHTTITAEIAGGSTSSSSVSIPITISPIALKEPENPTADDVAPRQFSKNTTPSFPTTGALSKFSSPVKSLSWHTYTCSKRIVETGDTYEGEDGNRIPIYEIVYDFSTNDYTGRIGYTRVNVSSDHSVDANVNDDVVKSGYGIEVEVQSNVIGGSSGTTGIQSFCAYFPEYNYKKYRRDGVKSGARLLDTVEFPVNKYSLKRNKVHFTPIWYPDGKYKVYVESFDAWTPAGMLCSSGTGEVKIEGAMWDNWYVQKKD